MKYEIDTELTNISIIPDDIVKKLDTNDIDKLLNIFDNLYMPISDDDIEEYKKFEWFDIDDVITINDNGNKINLIKVNRIYNTNIK